jgi:DNA topoisomerase-1
MNTAAEEFVQASCDPELVSPAEFAKEAGLRYVTDTKPGIGRIKSEEGSFIYENTKGETITDQKTIDRILALRIPPAWENVWICPQANGHIQATGLDNKGRKQYRYHAKWQTARNSTKFDKMLSFGKVLLSLREKVEKDLQKPHYSRDKILATVVSLLDNTYIRIGNMYYAKTNKSYGLTTLRNKHIKEEGNQLKISFVGKKNISQEIVLTDKRLVRIVRKCKELPGHQLFQYIDEEGNRQPVDSEDINSFLRENTGIDLTAKDFRTWGGSTLAIKYLLEEPRPDTDKEVHKKQVEAAKFVASKLGNTPTVCRNYYIHPLVFESYATGELSSAATELKQDGEESHSSLQPEEQIFLALLEKSPN